MGRKVVKSMEELRRIRAEVEGLGEEYVKNPSGHVTEYTDELADYICELISTNAMGLKKLSQTYGLPNPSVIFKWINKNKYFEEKYHLARKAQSAIMFDKVSEIADELKSYIDSEGVERADSGLVAMYKLKSTEYRRMAAILEPRKYSEGRTIEEKAVEAHLEILRLKRELDEKNEKDF